MSYLEDLLMDLSLSIDGEKEMPFLIYENPNYNRIIESYQEIKKLLEKSEEDIYTTPTLFDMANVEASTYVLIQNDFSESKILELQNNRQLKEHYEANLNEFIFKPLYDYCRNELIKRRIPIIKF